MDDDETQDETVFVNISDVIETEETKDCFIEETSESPDSISSTLHCASDEASRHGVHGHSNQTTPPPQEEDVEVVDLVTMTSIPQPSTVGITLPRDDTSAVRLIGCDDSLDSNTELRLSTTGGEDMLKLRPTVIDDDDSLYLDIVPERGIY